MAQNNPGKRLADDKTNRQTLNLIDKMQRDQEFPRFCLRLFMSCDVVGSTAFKHQGGDAVGSRDKENKGEDAGVYSTPASEQPAPHWLQTFSNFYYEFQRELDRTWEEGTSNNSQHADEIGDAPKLWKTLGDEVIFVKELENPFQVGISIDCFRRTVMKYRKEIQKSSIKLNLKASAWLAGFPVNNVSVIVGQESTCARHVRKHYNSAPNTFLQLFRLFEKICGQKSTAPVELRQEFIGPQMDLGFRVAAAATPRRMMITADIAYILAGPENAGTFDPSEDASKHIENRIQFDGTRELKGILSGIPYPMFWIECDEENEIHTLKDRLTGREKVIRTNVLEYCKQFIKNTQEHWILFPFIMCGKDSGKLLLGDGGDEQFIYCEKRRYNYLVYFGVQLKKAKSAVNDFLGNNGGNGGKLGKGLTLSASMANVDKLLDDK